ncbi:MAG: helix-hairpin-helix domain-containing protein, partial [Candidatus Bipolaricaulia bacterium]
KYRTDLDEAIHELTALELEDRVLPYHVSDVLEKITQMLRMESEITRMFVELGDEQDLPGRQLDSLTAGLDSEFDWLVEDYKKDPAADREEIKEKILSLPSQELHSTGSIMAPLGYEDEMLDSFLTARGYRLLNKMPRLPDAVIERLVERFDTLEHLLEAGEEELKEVKGVGEARASTITSGLRRLENRV